MYISCEFSDSLGCHGEFKCCNYNWHQLKQFTATLSRKPAIEEESVTPDDTNLAPLAQQSFPTQWNVTFVSGGKQS